MARKFVPHAPSEPCETCVFSSKIRHELGETDSSWRWVEADSPSARNGKVMHLHDSQGVEPFCRKFSNELRWARASQQYTLESATTQIAQKLDDILLVYLAHPVSGDFEANIANAHLWLEWANSEAHAFLELPADVTLVVTAPWLTNPKSVDHLPDIRARHMRWCCAAARRADEVWATGGRISKGMQEEIDHARHLRDLTHLGISPPFKSIEVQDKIS